MSVLVSGTRENLVILCVALVAFCSGPVLAAGSYSQLDFTEPLKVSRGKVAPRSAGAAYLSHDDSCRFLVSEQGWETGDCDGVENLLVSPAAGIDSAIVYKPVSEGHIQFEDWSQSKEAIDGLWSSFVDSMKEQSERLHKQLVPEGWLVYPTLDKGKAYMYYALVIDWDGQREINIKASLFDRSGYVPFLIVPERSDMAAADVEAVMTRMLAAYTSDPETSYFDFKSGDKVAAVGAVGVLATLMGIKLGKVAAFGLLATLLAFGKKFLIVLVALPLLALRRLFRRGDRRAQ